MSPSRLPYWLTALLVAALVLSKWSPTTGFTALLRFADAPTFARLPALQDVPLATTEGSAGYDGQFYAQIALAPALRDPALTAAIDSPAYRARRILMPAAAHALGLGRPVWVLNAFALLNVSCWAAFAWLLYRELDESYAGPPLFARWFACVCSMGALESLRQSLTDLPALLLLLATVRAARSPASAGVLSGIWAVLGSLTKETNILTHAALATLPRPSLGRLGWLMIVTVPLAAWSAYVAFRFPGAPFGAGNFTWPLAGALGQLALSAREVVSGNLDSRHTFALIAVPGLFLQAATLLVFRRTSEPWWRIGIVYAALLVFLGPWVWSGYWAACRVVLPLTLAFNLLLPAHRAFWPLFLAGNLPLLHAVWRFL